MSDSDNVIELAMTHLNTVMEYRLVEIRNNLVKVKNPEVLSDRIADLKEAICHFNVNSEAVSYKQMSKFQELREEYLILISLYE
ncbi:hypothetical protein BIY22_09990 [Vibrio panuliri]|uniref:Uncharacterized protein n=1 Tax=Vibrio panuliri TaxID=1381081 RepID=A0A1Q9HFI1_9VIBR|nr:hypothetical protein [Vibrio panuliri]OLQ88476.1 hypothetical protein BIY22_09990 [Vibrio panuliri]